MERKLKNLLQTQFHIPEGLLDGTHDKEPLTGEIFRLSGLDLAYLFLEVEKLLGRQIDTDKVLHYEFNTISGIVKLMEEA